jgi:hypothetical protein
VSVVYAWQAACDGFGSPVGRRGTDLLWGGLMRARHGDFVWLEHSGVLCVRRPLRRRSGGLIEFELAIQAGRCDGRAPVWQADGNEKRPNGRRLRESSDHLHVT